MFVNAGGYKDVPPPPPPPPPQALRPMTTNAATNKTVVLFIGVPSFYENVDNSKVQFACYANTFMTYVLSCGSVFGNGIQIETTMNKRRFIFSTIGHYV
jgi:hypothetical protein